MNRTILKKLTCYLFAALIVSSLGLVGCAETLEAYLQPPSPSHTDTTNNNSSSKSSPKTFSLAKDETPVMGRIYEGRVRSVIDGDTLHVEFDPSSSWYTKCRFIGIDAPEMSGVAAPLGQESKEHLEEIAAKGSTIYATIDKEPHDRHGRLLIYIWLSPEDAQNGDPSQGLVNYQMVYDGYAEALTVFPNVAYRYEIEVAEIDAETYVRGLWQQGDFTKSRRDFNHTI